MKKKIIYTVLFIFFSEIFFPLHLAAQEKELPDTITINSPGNNYPPSTDSAAAADDVANDTLFSRFRPIPFDTIKQINSDKGFYYKNYFDSLLRATGQIKRKEPKPINDSFFSLLFKLIIWIGAVGLFAFLVYKLFLSNSSLFARNKKNTPGEKMKPEDENPEDPASLVDLAVREGNYRLAVRYLFLQTLKNLADKKYLQTGTEKTNYQYVNEIRKHSFANEFASLTLQYEYVWYGEYPLTYDMFEQVHAGFKNFNKQIGR